MEPEPNHMPDTKRASSTRPGADMAMAVADHVDPATLGRLLVLFAILSQTIAKVRLFEDTDSGRAHVFETGLPATRDFLPLLNWFLADPRSASEEAVMGTPGQQVARAVATTRPPTTDPDPFVAAFQRFQRLIHLGDADVLASAPANKMPGTQDYGFQSLSELHADRSTFAWLLDQPTATRDTTLDVVFHRPTQTWRAEWSSALGLRGQSLAELRRTAPPQVPGEALSFDLPRDAYFTASDAAKHLGVDKSTVSRRVGRDQLVGFTVFKRALRIPKNQFLGPDVLPGIPEVLALFPQSARKSNSPSDHKSAWAFLNSDLFHGDPEPRPIDRLRNATAKGTTDLVVEDLARAKESLDRGDHL